MAKYLKWKDSVSGDIPAAIKIMDDKYLRVFKNSSISITEKYPLGDDWEEATREEFDEVLIEMVGKTNETTNK